MASGGQFVTRLGQAAIGGRAEAEREGPSAHQVRQVERCECNWAARLALGERRPLFASARLSVGRASSFGACVSLALALALKFAGTRESHLATRKPQLAARATRPTGEHSVAHSERLRWAGEHWQRTWVANIGPAQRQAALISPARHVKCVRLRRRMRRAPDRLHRPTRKRLGSRVHWAL